MAVGKVEQIITIRGDDQASKVVGEVQANFAKMGDRLKKAGEFFGDLERAGRGFKDVLGETASKELQDVLDKLGGMESLIVGGAAAFGPWGAAAGAAIGVGIIAYQKLSEYFKQDLVAAREAQQKALDLAKENEADLANRYLVQQNLLERQKEFTSSAEAEAAIRKQVNDLARTEGDILKAQKEESENLVELKQKQTRQQIEANVLAAKLNLLREQEQARTEAINKIGFEDLDMQRRITFATTEKQKRELQIQLLRQQGLRIVQEEQRLRDAGAAEDGKNVALNTKLLNILKERLAIAAQIAGLTKQQETEEKKSFAGGESRAAKRKARLAEIAKFEEEQAQQRIEDVARQADEELSALEAVAQARIAAADVSQQAALRIAEIERTTAINSELIANDVQINKETRAARLKALELNTATEIAAIQNAEAARIKSLEDKRLAEDQKREAERLKSIEDQKKRLQEARKATQDQVTQLTSLVGPAAAAAEAIAGPGGLAGALGTAIKETDRLTALWGGEKLGADAVIGAVGAVAAATVQGEKEKAAILAITSAAQAALFFATGQYPQAIAATTAAALYGAAAGGLIGGGASAPAGAAGGFAAAGSGGGAGGGGAAADMGGATTVINFTAPLGTPYEIGKSVAKAQKASSAGGWNPRMAMGV